MKAPTPSISERFNLLNLNRIVRSPTLTKCSLDKQNPHSEVHSLHGNSLFEMRILSHSSDHCPISPSQTTNPQPFSGQQKLTITIERLA
jgi:hypothetical protein